MDTKPNHNEYDDELVYYCKSCHSLNIKVDDVLADDLWDGSYCAKCNSCEIGTCTIDEWLEEEAKRAESRRKIEWSK